eukprot:gene22539-27508_t
MSGQDNQKPSSFSLRGSILKNLIGLWGVVQVVSVLANAIKRLLPLALQPFQTPTSLTPAQWVIYGVWSIYMMYAEGYKAFQCKFSPYVVQRAFSILDHAHKGDNATNAITTIINVLLAGPYSMGLFNASRKRMIVAWGVGIGVYALVRGVKYLPYPYRSIVDGGVVLGLTWGSLSILFLTIKALLGGKVEAKED